jgi:hypothetical protein
MYNTKVICSYHSDDVFLETDQISDEEKYFVRDAIYRQEVLDILGMEDYNEEEMTRVIHDLYATVRRCDEIMMCALKLSGHFMSDNREFGLMLLFAFDYMHLSHICISEYLETGKISEENIANLRHAVF